MYCGITAYDRKTLYIWPGYWNYNVESKSSFAAIFMSLDGGNYLVVLSSRVVSISHECALFSPSDFFCLAHPISISSRCLLLANQPFDLNHSCHHLSWQTHPHPRDLPSHSVTFVSVPCAPICMCTTEKYSHCGPTIKREHSGIF